MTSLVPACQKLEGGDYPYSVMRECNNSEINSFNHVSPHTNTIYTLKTSEARKEEEEVKFKCLGPTNYDVMVSGVIIASPNSDVILRNVEVNRPLARKRYAPRKQSLMHSKGILKCSLRGCSRTITKITLLLAIVMGVFGGLFNIRLPERKSTIGTSSSLSSPSAFVIPYFSLFYENPQLLLSVLMKDYVLPLIKEHF